MQFTKSALAAVLAFTSTSVASPIEARQDSLQEWEVTAVFSGTPSGRPGSYPWSTISANVTDTNELNLGTADSDNTTVTVPAGSQGASCKAQYFRGESPLGRTWPCDPTSDGYWTMTVFAGPDGSFSSTNFVLKFTHVADKIYRGQQFKATYEADGYFKTGDNLGGTCGGSGVCSWGLKSEEVPFKIRPSKA